LSSKRFDRFDLLNIYTWVSVEKIYWFSGNFFCKTQFLNID